ncbi:MAG: 50S ribosomal protein L18 [Elusimicrobiaceae bacterium]|jgi:large subunit ribosomal protein L18
MTTKLERYYYRKQRVRDHITHCNTVRPRLSVYRSLRYIYAQVIDDNTGKTLASASTLSKELNGKLESSNKSIAAAAALGELIAKKALEAGIKEVCFDRGGRVYHGRIKAVADGARKAGLKI